MISDFRPVSDVSKRSGFYFRWYFGKISREVGEVYLGADNNVAGSFLIRDSSKPGDFALDVKFYDENQFDKEQGKRKPIPDYLIMSTPF